MMRVFLLLLVLLVPSIAQAATWYVTQSRPSGACAFNGDGTASTCAASNGAAGAWAGDAGASTVVWGPGGVAAGDTLTIVGADYKDGLTVGADGPITITQATGATIYAPVHFRVNDETDAAYFLHGHGNSESLALVMNGRFTSLVGGLNTNFTAWTETVGTGASIIQETTVVPTGETASAKLQNGTSGTTRLSNDLYATKTEAYQFTYQCKSDGTATATVRFNDTTSLSNTPNASGVYDSWNVAGGDFITALACTAADTAWTTKSITILADASNHAPTLQITVSGANGTKVYVARMAWRHLWTSRGSDVWSQGTGVLGTSQAEVLLRKGTTFTDQAADENSVTASAIWYRKVYSTNYASIYLYSPEGDPGSLTYTGGDIFTTGTSTSAGFDINSKPFITLKDLDVRVAGYVLAKNVANDFTLDGVTALLMGYVTNVTARNRMEIKNSTLTYGDWIVNLSGCTDCAIHDNTVSHAVKIAGLSTEGGLISFDSTAVATDRNRVYANTLSHAIYGVASHGATARPSTQFWVARNDISAVHIGLWAQDESTGLTKAQYVSNYVHDLTPAAGSVGACVTTGQSVGYLGYRASNDVLAAHNRITGTTHGLMLGISANGQRILNNDVTATVKNVAMCSMTTAAFTANTINGNNYVTDGAAAFEYVSGADAVTSTTFAGFVAHGLEANGLLGATLWATTKRRSGVVWQGACLDIRGRPCWAPPDIGAYQSTSGDPANTRAVRQ